MKNCASRWKGHVLYAFFVFSLYITADESSKEILLRYKLQASELRFDEQVKFSRLTTDAKEQVKQLTANSDLATTLWGTYLLELSKENSSALLTLPTTWGTPENVTQLINQFGKSRDEFINEFDQNINKLRLEADEAFASWVRQQVRADQIEKAVEGRHLFRSFDQNKEWMDLTAELTRIQKAFTPKTQLPSVKSFDHKEIPPDAPALFKADNPALLTFLKSIKAVSCGYFAEGITAVQVGNQPIVQGKRGLLLLAMFGSEIIISDHYDSYKLKSESLRFSKDIQSLPLGSFVVIVVHDDATRRFSGEAQSSLIRLGASKGIKDLPYRSSYLLIGINGMVPGHAVELYGKEAVRYPKQGE